MRLAVFAVLCLLTLPALGAPASPAPSPFDAVRARLDAVPAGSPVASLVAQERANVGLADSFRDALALPASGRTAALLGLAGGKAARVPPVAFDRPSVALASLAESRGVAVDASRLAVLDDHPLAPQLLAVADRFLRFQDAAQAAYGPLATAVAPDLDALAQQMDAAPDWMPEQAIAFAASSQVPPVSPDAFASLLDARAALIRASADLAEAAQAVQAGPRASAAQVAVPPAFAIDLDGADSTYTEDIVLTVDVGGNDLYLNNAGGSNIDPLHLRCPNLPTGSTAAGAGALIDLGGDDRHESWRNCGINGGGRLGAGFLYDAGGRDTYFVSSGGTNGGGWMGLGFLYDGGAGADNYTAYASTGRLGVWGVNGGGMGTGDGFLLDEGGPDTYVAGVGGTNGGGYLEGGRGILVDSGAESDLFSADWLGTNGGGNYAGAGALLDGGGDDTYLSSTYIQFGYGTNGGGSAGTGLLYDAGGSDTYSALDSGTNGGANAGIGLLLDESGNDHYTATSTTGNGAAFGGLGLLWDRSGADTYSDGLVNCTDCDVVPKGIVGAQLDD
jgi:hypothetical protein